MDEIDKFADFYDTKRSPNGVLYLTKNTNSFMSAYVKQEVDLGTHIMFIAQLVEAVIFSDVPTVTYDFYYKNALKGEKFSYLANSSRFGKSYA